MGFFNWLVLVFLSILPLVELRLAIPVGILSGSVSLFFGWQLFGLGLSPLLVFVTAVVSNILLGFGIYDLLTYLDKKLHHSSKSYWYVQFVDHTREKLSPFIKKYGLFGVVLFIALPIPGSGVYIGSIGSQVIGISRSSFRKACVLGVIMAALFITILALTSQSLFS